MKKNISVALTVALLLASLAPSLARVRPDQFRVDYTVEVLSTEDHLFHITTDIGGISAADVDLSLPTWTPGWYTIENYAKNVLRFRVTDAKGAVLPHTLTHKQTWRIPTRGIERIKVEYDYRADVLALNQAKITNDFAFFTGTELFLMVEGHRKTPCTVRLVVPKDWKIATALNETSDPLTFTAPDYDALVDMPTEMGHFDATPFEVQGKHHYFVSAPAGAFAKNKAVTFTEMLSRVAVTEGAVFGELPYDKYMHFYFFARPESNASGALEHQNSFVAFGPPAQYATPENMIGTAAHEFFHLWNVKRLRPIEMWPYDYSRENETPLLWVSEGFTNYYANVALYRSGLRNREAFLHQVEAALNGVETDEARSFISPAESSISTWIGYDTPVAFGISYYIQGENLGALLDLSIIHDTEGAASLDDIMKSMYREFYQNGKGFSTEDMIRTLNRATKRDYHDFFSQFVEGAAVPPYETILGYAGCKVEKSSEADPKLGVDAVTANASGVRLTHVAPGSPAAEAGLRTGDTLLTVGGVEARRGLGAIKLRLQQSIGQTLKVEFSRDGEVKTVDMKVTLGNTSTSYKIVELAQPTAEQRKVRDKWLKSGA